MLAVRLTHGVHKLLQLLEIYLFYFMHDLLTIAKFLVSCTFVGQRFQKASREGSEKVKEMRMYGS